MDTLTSVVGSCCWLTVSDSLFFPLVMRANPCVSIATAVLCTCSSMYQLMKELLPAEWLPISKMVIFLRGSKRDTPTSLLSLTSPAAAPGGDQLQLDRHRDVPLSSSEYSSWQSLSIRSLIDMAAVSAVLAAERGCCCFLRDISPQLWLRREIFVQNTPTRLEPRPLFIPGNGLAAIVEARVAM